MRSQIQSRTAFQIPLSRYLERSEAMEVKMLSMLYAITMHCTACFGPYSSVTPDQKIVHLADLYSHGEGRRGHGNNLGTNLLPMGSVMLTCCLVVRQIPYLKDAKAELMRKAESIPPSFFSMSRQTLSDLLILQVIHPVIAALVLISWTVPQTSIKLPLKTCP